MQPATAAAQQQACELGMYMRKQVFSADMHVYSICSAATHSAPRPIRRECVEPLTMQTLPRPSCVWYWQLADSTLQGIAGECSWRRAHRCLLSLNKVEPKLRVCREPACRAAAISMRPCANEAPHCTIVVYTTASKLAPSCKWTALSDAAVLRECLTFRHPQMRTNALTSGQSAVCLRWILMVTR